MFLKKKYVHVGLHLEFVLMALKLQKNLKRFTSTTLKLIDE